MPKKGENIYKRKDGRWEGRYIKAYRPDGKAQYSYVYGKTYTDAKQKLLTARIDHSKGKETKRRPVQYKDVMRDWLTVSRLRIKESTYSRYVQLANSHIIPYLGEMYLDQLNTQVVEQHIVFLLSEGRLDGEGGLAPKTTSDILTVIKGSIEYGRCCGYMINCYLDKLVVEEIVGSTLGSDFDEFLILRVLGSFWNLL